MFIGGAHIRTCTFAGHRSAIRSEDAKEIPAALRAAIEEILQLDDVFCFYFSGTGWFDALSAQEVARLRSAHPEKQIEMTLVLPYQNRSASRGLYDKILIPGELRSLQPDEVIPYRNRWLVEHSQYLIAYVRRSGNTAADILKYAKALNANITLL